MKLLSVPEPRIPDPKVYRCTCKYCTARLEYDTNDLEVFESGLFTWYFIRCPNCYKWIFRNFIQRWWDRYTPPILPDYPGP